MARKFLYLIVLVVVVVLAGALALNYWSHEATKIALVPKGEFVEQEPLDANAYQDPAMWYSRPGIGLDDPARWQPAIAELEDATRDGEGPAPEPGASGPAPSPNAPAAERSLPRTGPVADPLATTAGSRRADPADPEATPEFAVFFVHPTSYIPLALSEQADWNASLDDATSSARARLFLRGMASAFNRADEIWAPKYRQAVAGAFLTDKPEAQQAFDTAYRDVAQAFEYFVASIDPDKPIVLAGHSQGALHVLTLLREKVAGTPLEQRIAAVYAPGWPVSVEHDLDALPLPACAAASQAGCLIAWSSFSDDGDPSLILERYRSTPGFDGEPRGDGAILCVNPLTGATGGEAPAADNLGTLVPNADLTEAELVPGGVPARCDARGLLLIGDPPELGQGVLPGGNYHVYDIPLFWKNLQEDVVRRVEIMGDAPLITENAEAFAAALPDGGLLIGLDLGTRTIGVAICDAGWRFATPGKTLPKGKFGRDAAALGAIAQERRASGIVLGLPRNMDGREGPRAQASRAFARNLATALGLPILLWDERWSTISADAAMIAQDTSRARRAERIDSHAAAVILQAAIDRLAGGGFANEV